ncbi:DUF222 domain-containing protein [Pseudonocardia nantongensis]|uniref:HNH endonuclease signature motif containing protein n=1 Tax=Pseudonocardia nantongensis TaxID=1181885 RepID=UPI00397A65AA
MQPMVLPQGVAGDPPGPGLCALLAGLDPALVANGDTVALLQAWRRLRSYVDAHELAAMAEVGRCDPHATPGASARLAGPDPGCGQEIAAALTLTEQAAWREHALAEMLVHRLPTVHAALAGGHIDRGKATVFADQLEFLDDAQATRICAALVPEAPGLTTGQLRARLQRMVIAIDPESAQRRYRRALRERRVICYLDAEGTATISATGLDPSAAQAACERVDALARAVRAAGHPDRLPSIRADVAIALLDGSLHAMSHDQIVATMLARAAAPDPDTTGSTGSDDDGDDGDGDGDGDLAPTPRGGIQNAADSGQADPDDPADPDRPADPDGRPEGGAPESDRPGGPDDSHSPDDPNDPNGPGDPNGPDDPDGPNDPDPAPGGPDPGAGGSEPARSGIEIRVRLSTLIGHDDHPGEIPGLGPVLAPIARASVARQRHAEWRFASTDTDGYLLLAGITRRRPTGSPAESTHPLIRNAHGGTVELQVPAELLDRLAAHPPSGWEPLVADLVAQYAHRDRIGNALDRRPLDRFPHPALRRHVEIRDRTCVFPGCRRPARKTQQDHTRDHQYGGTSVKDNLGPLCVLHHGIKTVGLWRLHQPAPGIFRWRSALHRIYVTHGEPVCPPLPESLAGPWCPEPPPAPLSRLERELGDQPLDPTAPATATRSAPRAPTAGRAPPERSDDDPPF